MFATTEVGGRRWRGYPGNKGALTLEVTIEDVEHNTQVEEARGCEEEGGLERHRAHFHLHVLLRRMRWNEKG